ncbi:zf-HC2 domain-containing protein [Streptomyces bohaiensis]|uniref:zf-HC2 domain-containing protein n=1 Tax=Streptomyces bohaiensis TaxID=1431344 RepID=UPI003B7F081D
MTGDHPSERLLAAYVSPGDRPTGAASAGPAPDADVPAGPLTPDELWAVESHLEGCGPCRARVAVAVDRHRPDVTGLLDAVRRDLGPALDSVAPAPPRRRRLPAGWATPAMAPWLAMVTCLTLAALLLDLLATHTLPVPAVLVVAPALPLLGVAAAWSRGLDPAFELTVATPRSGLGLLLGRTLAVLLLLFPLLLVAGALTGVGVAAWLLPAIALTSAALALGSVVGVPRAVTVLGALWAVAVAAPALVLGTLPVVLHPDHLGGWAALLVLGAAVVALRRHAFAAPGPRGAW